MPWITLPTQKTQLLFCVRILPQEGFPFSNASILRYVYHYRRTIMLLRWDTRPQSCIHCVSRTSTWNTAANSNKTMNRGIGGGGGGLVTCRGSLIGEQLSPTKTGMQGNILILSWDILRYIHISVFFFLPVFFQRHEKMWQILAWRESDKTAYFWTLSLTRNISCRWWSVAYTTTTVRYTRTVTDVSLQHYPG